MTTAANDGGSASGPTVLRMLLGAHLRRLREASGVTREAAGYVIRSSDSKISRMELGRVSFKERDVADLLTLYGVSEADERERLLMLARSANSPGWWHRYSDLLPEWFQTYLGLETAAAQIRTYEVQFIPGLLQTREYAQAVVLLGHAQATNDEIERRIGLRMARQQVLDRDVPLQLWAVVDEAVLRRPIGGSKVIRGQIEALIEATMLPSVRIQVLPFHVGGHPAAGGAFSIMRFPEQDLPDVVYVEQLTSALYLDKRDDVDSYAAVMESLCLKAEPPDRTPDILQRILSETD